MAKGALKLILYIASAIMIVLGIIFMISTNLGIQYFFEGLVFIALAVLLLFFSLERKPVEIKQTLEISGAPKIKEVKCPNCGAILDPKTVHVIDGRPYLTCVYCGNKFELTEEPKW